MKKLRIVFLGLSLTVLQLNAQDARFSQAYSSPLRLNPAIMGANYDLKAGLNYRSQWANIDKGYSTVGFSLLSPVYFKQEKEKLDLGFNVNSDTYGAFKATDFSLSVGYALKLSQTNSLSVALQYGYMQKSLSAANLSFDEQYVDGTYSSLNPVSEMIANNKTGYSDLGFGALWFYNGKNDSSGLKAFAGVSGYHLNQPNESFVEGSSPLTARFSYIAGIKIVGDKQIDFTPNVRVTQQQGASEIAAGIYTDYRLNANAKMVLGVWYRSHDAFALALGFEHKSFAIAYSYDMVTDLNAYVTGVNANELSLCYKFNMAEKKNISTLSSALPGF